MSIKKTFLIKEAHPLDPPFADAMRKKSAAAKAKAAPAAPKKDDFNTFLTKPYPDGGPKMTFAPIPKQVADQIVQGLDQVENHLSDGWDFGDRRMQDFNDAVRVIQNVLRMVGTE